jgi:hypothetical protein
LSLWYSVHGINGRHARGEPNQFKTILRNHLELEHSVLNLEQDFSFGRSSLDVLVGLGGLLEFEGSVDAHVQFTVGNPIEQIANAPHQFLTVKQVMPQGRTGHEQRAFFGF